MDDLSKVRREKSTAARIPRIGIRVQRLPCWEVKIWFGGRSWFCILCALLLVSVIVSSAMCVDRVVTRIGDGNWRMLSIAALLLMAVAWIVALSCVWLMMLERAVRRVEDHDDGGDS